MEKSAVSTWTRVMMVAVTVTLCVACAQPSAPLPPIQDKIDRDARLR